MNKYDWIKWQKTNRNLTMPIMTFPVTKALNMTVDEMVKSASKQALLIQYIANHYPTSVALGFMDLSVEAEAFGSKVKFFKYDVPTIIGSIIKTNSDANNLVIPNTNDGRIKIYIEGIKKAKEMIHNKPVFACTIGPFSLAGRLMDMTELMVNCYVNPSMVEKTLEKTTAFIIDYILAFKAVGADGVMIAEPAVGLLSPELCRIFSTKYMKQIKEAVSDSNFVFGYHNCGDVVSIANEIIEIGADIYHFGNAIDIEKMLKILPKESLVMGNIQPSQFINDSSKNDICSQTLNLLKRCNNYENFVISTGCDMPCETSLNNVEAYFNTITDFFNSNL